MSKGSRDRQQAREKITKMRPWRRGGRRRRSWVAGIGAAVVVIAVAVGITLAVAGSPDRAHRDDSLPRPGASRMPSPMP